MSFSNCTRSCRVKDIDLHGWNFLADRRFAYFGIVTKNRGVCCMYLVYVVLQLYYYVGGLSYVDEAVVTS